MRRYISCWIILGGMSFLLILVLLSPPARLHFLGYTLTPYPGLDNSKHELIVRCFLYLFPSHQTWFLVFLLVVFM
jgi:hypothetical protein